MTNTAVDPKTMQRLFMGNPFMSSTFMDSPFVGNPFMSQWLSIANTMAGTVRGFWAAELSRMQTAGIQAFSREAMRAWSNAWAAAPSAIDASVTMPAKAEIVAVGEASERAMRRAMPAKLAAAKVTARPRAKAATPKVQSRKSSSAKRPSKSR